MTTMTMTIRIWRRDLLHAWRAGGWRAVLRRGGWKLVAAVVTYYLVRDLVLYVILPMGVLNALR
jgi:hypothetical protein